MTTNQSQYEEMCEIYTAYQRKELVEVVRCMDCRYFDHEGWDAAMGFESSYCLKKLPGLGYAMCGNGPTSYCSYGKRKSDA